MALTLIPPVGHRFRADSSKPPALPLFNFQQSVLLNCGTAALALALRVAARQCEAENPTVIIPAYGCPDLVAAALYAGVKPLLLDCSIDSHALDLAALEAALDKNVVAVLAVNLLGVSERLQSIRARLDGAGHPALLIEDNAQWWPEYPVAAKGDLMLSSFGRGKPVNVLGGGVLWALPEHEEALRAEAPERVAQGSRLLGLKGRVFNLLLHPLAYAVASRVPALKVGVTEFHALTEIAAMDASRRRFLQANIDAWCARERVRELRVRDMLAQRSDLLDLTLGAAEGHGRLLRYPLLCADNRQRDQLLQRLISAGIGATEMYGRALADIPEVADKVLMGTTANARNFAGRLLTLPLHEGVKPAHLEIMAQLLKP